MKISVLLSTRIVGQALRLRRPPRPPVVHMLSRAILTALALTAVTAAQQGVSFPTQDGGLMYADMYGKGDRGVVLNDRGVVLAHGGRSKRIVGRSRRKR